MFVVKIILRSSENVVSRNQYTSLDAAKSRVLEEKQRSIYIYIDKSVSAFVNFYPRDVFIVIIKRNLREYRVRLN